VAGDEIVEAGDGDEGEGVHVEIHLIWQRRGARCEGGMRTITHRDI
jgi:hypothetical protein